MSHPHAFILYQLKRRREYREHTIILDIHTFRRPSAYICIFSCIIRAYIKAGLYFVIYRMLKDILKLTETHTSYHNGHMCVTYIQYTRHLEPG